MARRFRLSHKGPSRRLFKIVAAPFADVTEGGYRIAIQPGRIEINGGREDGLRNGREMLARMVFLRNGKLWLPTGEIVADPERDWRGIHLFVGKTALAFHRKLWTNVLRPLGFNKVVLQCEQTAWSAIPGTETGITMSKPALVDLFKMYRALGIDPIPLVESYGHMAWLFRNGKNRDVACRGTILDPRKPRSKVLLGHLWDEVIHTLHPDTIHFGLDEIGKLPGPTSEQMTQLWRQKIVDLTAIAKSHRVKMMIWGDQCLSPDETPDDGNAENPKEALARRGALPKGTIIGDWHYAGDIRPQVFAESLQTWKQTGMTPIATCWNSPQNVAGFVTEANAMRVGTLQTTWVGYDSNEESMLNGLPDFAAMVLAADYGWSGRTELPDRLGYDPADVFRRMYFADPSPLQPIPGYDLGSSGDPFEVGKIRFGHLLNLLVSSPTVFRVAGRGSKLVLACRAARRVNSGHPIARVEILLKDGTMVEKELVYGWHVSATGDKAPLSIAEKNRDGISATVIDLSDKPTQIDSIKIIPIQANPIIDGMELLDD